MSKVLLPLFYTYLHTYTYICIHLCTQDERSPQLPYLTQDLWTCDRELMDIDAWVLENEDLKVTVTPQYAGRLVYSFMLYYLDADVYVYVRFVNSLSP